VCVIVRNLCFAKDLLLLLSVAVDRWLVWPLVAAASACRRRCESQIRRIARLLQQQQRQSRRSLLLMLNCRHNTHRSNYEHCNRMQQTRIRFRTKTKRKRKKKEKKIVLFFCLCVLRRTTEKFLFFFFFFFFAFNLVLVSTFSHITYCSWVLVWRFLAASK
jgi:hypothetical protein